MINRLLSLPLLLASTFAFAGPVTLRHEGTVKDALKAIAAQAGINLIVIGDLKEPMEVHLNGASAEDAMTTVAKAAQLQVQRSGSIWTIRAMTAEEKVAAAALVASNTAVISEGGATAKSGELADDPAKRAANAGELANSSATVSADRGGLGATLEDDPAKLSAKMEKLEELGEKFEAKQERLEDQREEQEEALEKARERTREIEQQKAALANEQAKLEKRLRKAFKTKGSDSDVVKTGGSLTVAEGTTVGNAVAYGGPVDVLGTVDGDVVAFGGSVHLGPKSAVSGDVVAFGGSIRKEAGAVVGGEEVSFGGATTGVLASEIVKQRQEVVHHGKQDRGFLVGVGSFFTQFAVLFALGFLFMLFAPQRMKALEAEISTAPLKSLLTGAVGLLAMLPLSVLLGLTVIGIPFIPALWIMAGVGITMGFAAFASSLGMRLPLFRGKKTQALVLAVGLFSMLIVLMIPVVGPIAISAITFIAFGAIIRTRFGSLRKLGQPTAFGEIPA